MKTLSVKDSNKQNIKGWSFGTFNGVWNAGCGRKISGWLLVSPDGYKRFCEGNWNQFVPFVQQIINNHGLEANIS